MSEQDRSPAGADQPEKSSISDEAVKASEAAEPTGLGEGIAASARIHPSAIIEAGASVGADCRIWHHVHVMPRAAIGARCSLGQGVFVATVVRLGADCKVQNHVSLYEGLVAGDGVFFGPSAAFTNVSRPRARTPRRDAYEETRIGADASIGANATIRCGLSLGEGAFVAAGAVVTRDVPPFTLVVGVPARARGIICRCGESPHRRNAEKGESGGVAGGAETWCCASCGRRYRRREAGGYSEI